jgi:ABC-type dipeptide/oligopeptide/nickel transport system permease component
MREYIAKRLLLALPVIFGVTVIVFAAVRLAPGDVAQTLAGLESDNEVLDAIRHEQGLDRPVYEQFGRYFFGLLQLDLGRSAATHLPVAEELAARFPTTAILAVAATAVAALVGVSLGVLAARFQRTWIDYGVTLIALAGLSVPSYVVGLLLILLFAVTLDLLPATGASTPMHFIMPVIAISLVGVGVLARQTRSAVLEVLSEDYVRTARAKGLAGRPVLLRHALPNALIPLTTVLGLLFGSLLGGTVIVETVFGIPGVGKYMVDRISIRDYPAVQGGVLLIASIYVFVNLITDLLYGIMDKRVSLR